jgi:hypothetical protein
MKRLICILALFLVLAPAVLAEGPGAMPQRLAPAKSGPSMAFPGIKLAIVDVAPDPHTRRSLHVAGEDWAFTLVERRWGWEIDTAYVDPLPAQLLMLASLDYLSGDAHALRIFADPDLEYLCLLDDLAQGKATAGMEMLTLRQKQGYSKH